MAYLLILRRKINLFIRNLTFYFSANYSTLYKLGMVVIQFARNKLNVQLVFCKD